MADDVVNVVIDKWDSSVCAIGLTKYQEDYPIEAIDYGISFSKSINSYIPRDIQSPYGYDYYNVYPVAHTQDEITALINQLIKMFDASGTFTLNTTYSRFFIDVDNIQFLLEWKERPMPNFRKMANLHVWCVKREHAYNRIYDPRYMRNMEGER